MKKIFDPFNKNYLHSTKFFFKNNQMILLDEQFFMNS